MHLKAAVAAIICFTLSLTLVAQEFAVGADVSFVKHEEDKGRVFSDSGRSDSCLKILRSHNFNWVRLRLFYNPTKLPNTLAYTIASAKQAKALGYKFLLDIHYSDTWADPQNQTPPQAWKYLSHRQLTDSVFSYTKRIIETFTNEKITPDIVQIGNEIANGFLWPSGKLPGNTTTFCELLLAGIKGAKAFGAKAPKIMLHIETGADYKNSEAFFDTIIAHKIPFDFIGLSYYPWWQGSLAALAQNLHLLAAKYPQNIFIIETSYNHKKRFFRKNSNNYPETPEGQKAYLQTVDTLVRNTPNHKGCGVFWWEPTYKKGFGNMFDKRGRSLPVITSFD